MIYLLIIADPASRCQYNKLNDANRSTLAVVIHSVLNINYTHFQHIHLDINTKIYKSSKTISNHSNYFIFCNQWQPFIQTKIFVFREPSNFCVSLSLQSLTISFVVHIFGYRITYVPDSIPSVWWTWLWIARYFLIEMVMLNTQYLMQF